MSVESIQAGKQLPNIAPEIINHERRPSKPKQTELWVLLAVVAVAFCSHFEPKLLSILDRFADPKPGVIDAVAALREAGLKIGSTTGYTDAMMEIVVPKAAELGYAPDHWVSADGTQGFVRPYPYMIFHNMQVLRLMDVRRVAKVGDTIRYQGGQERRGVHRRRDRRQLADGPVPGRVRGALPRRAGP